MALLAIPLFVLLTATLSGVFGMAGGLLLLGLLLATLPVPAAMVLHGTSQLVSNGARAYLLRRHARWPVVGVFALGAAVAAVAFTWIAVRPGAGAVLTTLGCFVLVASFVPASSRSTATSPAVALAGGAVVTMVQLFAGASGPLLDLLFARTTMDRREIVATKAVTQTASHLLKIGVYLPLLAPAEAPSPWLLLATAVMAASGARIGTVILARLNDRTFRRGTFMLVRTLAVLTLVQGLYQLA